MGMMICQKHGRQFMRWVCPHLSLQVREARVLSPFEERADFEAKELSFTLCPFCSRLHNTIVFENVETEPVCSACFEVAQPEQISEVEAE